MLTPKHPDNTEHTHSRSQRLSFNKYLEIKVLDAAQPIFLPLSSGYGDPNQGRASPERSTQ